MLYLGADHGGFRLKEHLKKFLAKESSPITNLINCVSANSYSTDNAFLSSCIEEYVIVRNNTKKR